MGVGWLGFGERRWAVKRFTLTLKLKSVHEKEVCSNGTVYMLISPDAGKKKKKKKKKKTRRG